MSKERTTDRDKQNSLH